MNEKNFILITLVFLSLLAACHNNKLLGDNKNKTNLLIKKFEEWRFKNLDLMPGAERCGEYYRKEFYDTEKFILENMRKSCNEYVKNLFKFSQKEPWMKNINIKDFKNKQVWENYKNAKQ